MQHGHCVHQTGLSSDSQLKCRFIDSIDMFDHFKQLRQSMQWTTEADLDKFLSAVIHTFCDIVQVWSQPILCSSPAAGSDLACATSHTSTSLTVFDAWRFLLNEPLANLLRL